MRLFCLVSLCCLVAGGSAVAQRGGGYGGGMRGGMGGGSFGGFRTGGFNGGFGNVGFARGGFGNGGFVNTGARIGNLNGFAFRGFRDGFGRFNNRFFFNSGFGFYGGYGWLPYGGYAASYWPPYAYSSYFPGYDYAPYEGGYATYQPSPNVTVIYPPQAVQPLSAERARPMTREYDQYGQEVRPAGSPLYLIAFKDHTIRAAISYRIDGNTLHYTTPERQDQQAMLDTVDRDLSMQLNRERNVPFQLPPQ